MSRYALFVTLDDVRVEVDLDAAGVVTSLRGAPRTPRDVTPHETVLVQLATGKVQAMRVEGNYRAHLAASGPDTASGAYRAATEAAVTPMRAVKRPNVARGAARVMVSGARISVEFSGGVTPSREHRMREDVLDMVAIEIDDAERATYATCVPVTRIDDARRVAITYLAEHGFAIIAA